MTVLSSEPRIVLIRHGQTDWSRDSKHTGSTDIGLNTTGEAEARLVAPTLRDWDFCAVFSSPLLRARQTAELAGFDGQVTFLDDLVEWDYGRYEGLTNNEIRASEPGWSKWQNGAAGGESADDVGRRADAAIETLVATCYGASVDGGDVAVFAHGHLLAILVARWLGLAASEGKRFVLDTATVTVLGAKRSDRVLRLFNHRCGTAIDLAPR